MWINVRKKSHLLKSCVDKYFKKVKKYTSVSRKSGFLSACVSQFKVTTQDVCFETVMPPTLLHVNATFYFLTKSPDILA